MIEITGLEESFDNTRAEDMLNLSFDRVTHTSDLVRKSMYDFDLETPDGIAKLMALIPIMDPEILKDVMVALWPGYPTDVDARRHRLEIKGFLKDYLDSYDYENEDEQFAVTGAGKEVGAPAADESASVGARSMGENAARMAGGSKASQPNGPQEQDGSAAAAGQGKTPAVVGQ